MILALKRTCWYFQGLEGYFLEVAVSSFPAYSHFLQYVSDIVYSSDRPYKAKAEC